MVTPKKVVSSSTTAKPKHSFVRMLILTPRLGPRWRKMLVRFCSETIESAYLSWAPMEATAGKCR